MALLPCIGLYKSPVLTYLLGTVSHVLWPWGMWNWPDLKAGFSNPADQSRSTYDPVRWKGESQSVPIVTLDQLTRVDSFDAVGLEGWNTTLRYVYVWIFVHSIHVFGQIIANPVCVKSLIVLSIPARMARGVLSWDHQTVRRQPRQIIATSHDLTSKGSWGRDIRLFQGGLFHKHL